MFEQISNHDLRSLYHETRERDMLGIHPLIVREMGARGVHAYAYDEGVYDANDETPATQPTEEQKWIRWD